MAKVNVTRLNIFLRPSQERVLIRPFIPPDETRVVRIMARIASMTDRQVREQLDQVFEKFGDRHKDMESVLLEHFLKVERWVVSDTILSDDRRLLTGAYFTQEYSLESAALFNPSIVPHPDQSGVLPGSVRFIMSLRATGEGHISSIVFREGVVDGDHSISVRAATPYVTEPNRIPNPSYDKHLFMRKLGEVGLDDDFTSAVMRDLGERFNYQELARVVENRRRRMSMFSHAAPDAESIMALASANYQVRFNSTQRTSERAIFPLSSDHANSIEDARFVLFEDEHGHRKYYATYTAFDGKVIIPQLLETEDFLTFRFITLNGPAVRNKGMALFPRKVNGCYAMLSRQDNENLFIMYSDNIHFWYSPRIVLRPTFSWEYVQLGNCGSPIETDAGWLVLSHGVGPMRRYCIGAFMLDKKDPSRVIGRLAEPLIQPNENEREGYVPNVVYTCGAMLHGKRLIIPYAMADSATSFAMADVDELIGAMQ